MSRPLIAAVNLARLSVGQKIVLGTGIDQALTLHPDVFKTPSPAQATLRAATTELTDAADEAATGSVAGRQRLKKAGPAFNKLMRQYVVYVNQLADGDGVIIGLSGLPTNRPAQKAGPLPAPTDGRLSGVIAGELTASVAPVAGAAAYVWLTGVGAAPPATDADWHLATVTTQAHVLLKGLASGTREWMRCAVVNSRSLGPYSEPVSRIVV